MTSIKEVWDVIDEYELLPTKINGEGLVIAPARTRHPSKAIIGIIELPLSIRGRDDEEQRRERHRDINRRVAFRMAINVLKDRLAKKAIAMAMDFEKIEWDLEETTRCKEAHEEAIREAQEVDPDMDPATIEIPDVTPRQFYNRLVLETILDKVIIEVLPTDALTNQLEYMKKTKKPRHMTAQGWINRLTDMREYLYWMSPNKIEIDNRTFNLECIKANIPLEWMVDFEKSRICRQIKKASIDEQLDLYDIWDELIQAKASEQTLKKLLRIKGKGKSKEDRHSHKNGRERNMCRIPGHHHK